jgi:CRP-like cAMP-binding protein
MMPPASDHQPLGLFTRRLGSIAQLSAEERQAIESLPANIRVLKPNQDIVRDGDKPSQCCLLLEGWAFRYKLIGEGRRQILSFHVPGDVPDLTALHIPSMDHSLAAFTKAKVAFIPHESLRELTVRFPNLAAVLFREALIEAAAFRQWIVALGRRSAYERVARLFCELYLKLEAVGLASMYSCHFPITQGELADAMGLSNVHVNRVLKEMRGNDLITLKGGAQVIHAWDKLVHAAEFDGTYLHL